jgi:mannose-6-phosphate isomerase-like protein (cupin superfamily)
MGSIVTAADGVSFEDAPDRGRVLAFGADTGARYGLMEYFVASRPKSAEAPNYRPHRHFEMEQTFFVQNGNLQFLLGETIFELGPGDFVRVPPGARHGFANVSGEEVSVLVGFHPGGFEELFVRHRSDQHPPAPPNGFIEDASREFATEFEDEQSHRSFNLPPAGHGK